MFNSFMRTLPERIAIFLITVIFFVLMGQIILRLCGIPFNWGQEFTTFAFIWLVFFGIAAAYCRGEHMVVDFLYNLVESKLDQRMRFVWLAAIEILQLLVMTTLAIGLVLMTKQSWELRAGSLPDFRIGYLYLGAFLAILASITAQLITFVVTIKSLRS